MFPFTNFFTINVAGFRSSYSSHGVHLLVAKQPSTHGVHLLVAKQPSVLAEWVVNLPSGGRPSMVHVISSKVITKPSLSCFPPMASCCSVVVVIYPQFCFLF
jgi:hypothetical protein